MLVVHSTLYKHYLKIYDLSSTEVEPLLRKYSKQMVIFSSIIFLLSWELKLVWNWYNLGDFMIRRWQEYWSSGRIINVECEQDRSRSKPIFSSTVVEVLEWKWEKQFSLDIGRSKEEKTNNLARKDLTYALHFLWDFGGRSWKKLILWMFSFKFEQKLQMSSKSLNRFFLENILDWWVILLYFFLLEYENGNSSESHMDFHGCALRV